MRRSSDEIRYYEKCDKYNLANFLIILFVNFNRFLQCGNKTKLIRLKHFFHIIYSYERTASKSIIVDNLKRSKNDLMEN